MSLDHLLFLLMSLLWGITWTATKAGLAVVPPLFFGAVRYILVCAVMVFVVRDLRGVFRGHALRLIVTGALTVVGCYGFLYWGMLYVPSGVAGLVNLSMNPVCLFGFAILLGQERATWRHALALALGVAGLVILFAGKADVAGTTSELWGAAALVAAALSYCLGSVLSRPLLDHLTPLQLTAAQAAVGAAGLTALSLLFEPISPATFRAMLQPVPLAAVFYLVIGGTFVAYTIFLRLVRDWGASRAGLYSFVSPVVALTLGALVYGEPLGWREAAGAAIMLLAAAIAVARRPVPASPAPPE